MTKKSAKKTAARKSRTRKAPTEPRAVILDAVVHLGTYLHQHVALEGPVKPVKEWDFDDILEAAHAAVPALPTNEALTLSSASWCDTDLARSHRPGDGTGTLSLMLSTSGSFPFLTVTVRDFPIATALRALGPHISMAHAFMREPVRDKRPTAGNAGCPPAPGTIINPYEHRFEREDFDREQEQRRRAELGAIQAARRARHLPILPQPRKRGAR